ncbi:hypothetical protein CHISP_3428 [Chitinispirillum alkaliphilum]|nr:hypothetical protein CHISP_3428 [Chitinispirillum alkaliphilum]
MSVTTPNLIFFLFMLGISVIPTESSLLDFPIHSLNEELSSSKNGIIDSSDADEPDSINVFKRNEISIGNDNILKSDFVNGGRYIDLSYSYYVLRRLAFGAKASTDLAPYFFKDFILSSHLTYVPRFSERFGSTLSIFVLANVSSFERGREYFGFRLAPFSTTDEDMRIEFLPFSVAYNHELRDFLVSYNFVNFHFKF